MAILSPRFQEWPVLLRAHSSTILGFMMFKNKIRHACLTATIVMGTTALLMHAHYSINVFSAFFITYRTYKLGQWFFKKVESN